MTRPPSPSRATAPPNGSSAGAPPPPALPRGVPDSGRRLAPWRIATIDLPEAAPAAPAFAPDLSLVALRLVRAAALALRAVDPAAADVGDWLLAEVDRRLAERPRDGAATDA